MLDKVTNYRYEFLRNFNDELWNICLYKRFYNFRYVLRKVSTFCLLYTKKFLEM